MKVIEEEFMLHGLEESMINKVTTYVKKYNMLCDQDTVIAGISGGADSVCLLFVLSEIQKQIPFQLAVVHVNHLIRDNAAQDADYVKKLCDYMKIPFYLVEKDVSSIAQTNKISEEEAGRTVRYEAFDELLWKIDQNAIAKHQAKIAVAHNLNDRAETMLFHLCRGSGINGLASIRPVKKRIGKPDIIRPLLSISRKEIEDYLTKLGVEWCIDSTNEEDTYTRNRIRHHVLPCMEKEIFSGAISNMGRAADILAETDDYVQIETEKAYNSCVASNRDVLSVTGLLKLHPFLQKQVILYLLKKITPALKDIAYTHVESILSLFYKDANRQIHLPYGILVRRNYEEVCFLKEGEETSFRSDSFQLKLPNPYEAPQCIFLPNQETMEFKVFANESSVNIMQNKYTKWFDYDKIEKSLTIRTRQTKDFLTINEENSKKTIQDYMVDEKIPRDQRDQIWLLAEENHILWVVGHRISNYYKVKNGTKYILQVQFRGGQ